MSYLNVNDLAEAASFRARVKVALVNAAGSVLNEAADAYPAAQQAKRYALANNVLRDPAAIVPAFIWPVLSNVSIATAGLDATDGDILYQVDQVWDSCAGVTAGDKVPPA